jgi:carbon monoxide dehydrogenase subunit G
MRFTGERQVPTPVDVVWSALHDGAVLRDAIPGVEELVPLGSGRYAATLAARVGPVADTYRGSFTIEDPAPDEIRVGVQGRGRFGRLTLDLCVVLADGSRPGSTSLRYDARAGVTGFVARVGTPAMTVVGGHLTGVFFRDLERALRAGARRTPAPAPAFA